MFLRLFGIIAALVLYVPFASGQLDLGNSGPSIVTAVESGSVSDVRAILLNRQDTPNRRNYSSVPVLIVAVKQGNLQIVRLLLEAGARVDDRDPGSRTALIWAANQDRNAIAKTLITAGADVDISDDQGETPLIIASRFGFESVVQTLIDEGADPNVRDFTGRTPLAWAKVNQHSRVALLLRFAGGT